MSHEALHLPSRLAKAHVRKVICLTSLSSDSIWLGNGFGGFERRIACDGCDPIGKDSARTQPCALLFPASLNRKIHQPTQSCFTWRMPESLLAGRTLSTENGSPDRNRDVDIES
jgi:hypothetical protein